MPCLKSSNQDNQLPKKGSASTQSHTMTEKLINHAAWQPYEFAKTLEVREGPSPQPQEDEVVVKVFYVGIAPGDWKVINPDINLFLLLCTSLCIRTNVHTNIYLYFGRYKNLPTSL